MKFQNGLRIGIVGALGFFTLVEIACGNPRINSPSAAKTSTIPFEQAVTSTRASDLYERARYNEALQKEWVIGVLSRYGIKDLFGDIVIITPKNANIYPEYNREKRIRPDSGNVVTYAKFKIEDFGTEKVPLPTLYVPTEVFASDEKDLEGLIGFHEGQHAKSLRQGFEFGGIQLFAHRDDPNIYNASMFTEVFELEAQKKHFEGVPNLIDNKSFQSEKHSYLTRYVQLWRYGGNIKEGVAEMLQERYFRPWMVNVNSFWVYEESPGIVKYGGDLKIPFFLPGEQRYVQFQFKQGETYTMIKLKLPPNAH